LDIYSPLNNFLLPFIPFSLTLLLNIVSLAVNRFGIQDGEAVKAFLF
jgi:hypothetical protein